MAVTVYKSNDASAPALTGAAGSLCTVLDAVLVNGYGAKAAAGWAIPFTGTNLRIYRAPSGAMRGFMRVDDAASRAAPFANGCEARISGSEGATAISTRTGVYPPTTNGIILRKSISADSTARPWIVVADARTMYMFVQSGDYGNGWASFMFGEYFSLKPTSDGFNSLIAGSITEQLIATPTPLALNENLPKLSTAIITTAGHFTPRSWNGEFGPITTNMGIGKHGHGTHSNIGLVGLIPYPNPLDSAIYISQCWLHEPMTLGIIRGRLRGFWHLLHPASSLVNGDTWSGAGALAGKTFLAISPVPDGLGSFVMETSDTWETN